MRIAAGGRGGEAGEGGAVVAHRRAERVEDLAEAVRAGVVEAGLAPVGDARPGGGTEGRRREDDKDQHHELDVVGLDLLAEILGRAADHQPGDEDREDHEHHHAVEARADAAEDDFARLHVEERDEPAERRERIVHGVDGAARGVGGDRGEERGAEDAEADLLALHVAVGGGETESMVDGIAARLGLPADERAGDEKRGHRTPDGPAVARAFHHAAEVKRERARNREDREHLEKVGERRGILEGMRGVGVGVAAAIGAEHLDRDLRSHRSLDDGLRVDHLIDRDGRLAIGGEHGFARVIEFRNLNRVGLQRFRRGVGFEILNHALRHQKQREHQAHGDEQVVGDADEVGPKTAEGPGILARDAAHEGGGDADAGGSGGEIVDGQPDHLGEIRQGRFTAVALPVGVGREARGGVERERRREPGEILRVERQEVLEAQHEIGEEQADHAEREHGERVAEPALLLFRIDAAEPIGEPLERLHDWVEKGVPPRIEHAN